MKSVLRLLACLFIVAAITAAAVCMYAVISRPAPRPLLLAYAALAALGVAIVVFAVFVKRDTTATGG
jgi:hypothetical protein